MQVSSHPTMSKESNSPFNDTSTSDVILVSSDNVHFHVHKLILSLASPLFKDMFTLPQPCSPSECSSTCAPTIELTESSQCITSLLQLIYPVPDPDLTDLNDILPVLEASVKYQLSEATHLTRAALRRIIPKKPLEVYAAACRFDLEEEARLAARHWMSVPKADVKIEGSGRLTPWDWTVQGACCIPELQDVSAGAVYRLMRFAKSGVDPGKFVHPDVKHSVDADFEREPELWYDDGDVVIKSSDGYSFKVHQLVLQLTSKILVEHNLKVENDASLLSVSLPETGQILAPLLRMCYLDTLSPMDPSCEPQLSLSVREAAITYSMHGVLQVAQQRWMEAVSLYPFKAFFIAKPHEKLTIAKLLFRKGLPVKTTYIPEMENYPARDYFRLLQYFHKCKIKLVEVCSAFERKPGEYWDEGKSAWWRSTKHNDVLMLGLPIVQRELRRNNAVVDLGRLVKESEDMSRSMSEALDKVSLEC